ncbi:uncharacterized protein LOC103508922 [Diaphorina citri]|uniref:Uncharacterized protein LOC103508922 n=1 Tax=Diaphorina citri TaxID=121845 RepID=A0A1S3D0J6_DIACI|nr:uncharacterized protein LOC103508922 [Diaphorina citri]
MSTNFKITPNHVQTTSSEEERSQNEHVVVEMELQSIDLHRFDSQIARRALAVEKANEKVRSLEIPSYNVLLEKTINLRKVPERLQVKKVEPQLPEISEELETLIKRMKCSGRMDTVVSKIGLEEITKDQL